MAVNILGCDPALSLVRFIGILSGYVVIQA